MSNKIKLDGVPETMLQTLWARANESKKENHVIYDEEAINIIGKLDYDFSKAQNDKLMSNGVIARTVLLDKMVNDYLSKYKNTTVINIACGLDTRCYRMKNLYKNWYNLDLPQTIDVRRIFMEENGPVYDIAKSATDESWTNEVADRSENILVIIEGLTMYLNESDVKKIFEIISKHFKNTTVFVETMNPLVVKSVKEKSIKDSASFSWGVKNGKAFNAVVPEFKFIEERSLAEGMEKIMPIYKFLQHIKPVREISNKILVLER